MNAKPQGFLGRRRIGELMVAFFARALTLEARYFVGALSLIGLTSPAIADSCKSNGGLTFLGDTPNNSSSVWLSGTGPGSFELDAAQGNQTVDTWDKTRRGLHISISPVVSNGNGGTHKLYETDTSNTETLKA